MLSVAVLACFVYHRSMNAESADAAVSRIAAAIGEPARARMLFCLMDGHARTATELAAAAEVGASTASAHLNRLRDERLLEVHVQGKHRYYRLAGPWVAKALEALSVLAGGQRLEFRPSTPSRLRDARTCYDHMAGTVAVALHDRIHALGWLERSRGSRDGYELTASGERRLEAMGVDVAASRALRRRFAYACLDWSERRPHLGGALGAALLQHALQRKWVVQDLDSRALTVTSRGQRELSRLGTP